VAVVIVIMTVTKFCQLRRSHEDSPHLHHANISEETSNHRAIEVVRGEPQYSYELVAATERESL